MSAPYPPLWGCIVKVKKIISAAFFNVSTPLFILLMVNLISKGMAHYVTQLSFLECRWLGTSGKTLKCPCFKNSWALIMSSTYCHCRAFCGLVFTDFILFTIILNKVKCGKPVFIKLQFLWLTYWWTQGKRVSTIEQFTFRIGTWGIQKIHEFHWANIYYKWN